MVFRRLSVNAYVWLVVSDFIFSSSLLFIPLVFSLRSLSFSSLILLIHPDHPLPKHKHKNGHRYSRRTSQSSDALRIGETMARRPPPPFFGRVKEDSRAPARPVFFLTSRIFFFWTGVCLVGAALLVLFGGSVGSYVGAWEVHLYFLSTCFCILFSLGSFDPRVGCTERCLRICIEL
jgi:hypothetical protein